MINLSTILSGQRVGIREVADEIWLVSFMQYDPGFFDEDVAGLAQTATGKVPATHRERAWSSPIWVESMDR